MNDENLIQEKRNMENNIIKPHISINQLPMLSAAKRKQLLYEFNDTAAEFSSNLYVHQLFEQQVEKTPDAIALVYEQHQLTYRQLNQKANQLAHYLKSLGVGPEAIVGLCVERSLQMVVGLLGVLKAGGAYLPLDHKYPQERLAFMLEDSNASLVLGQQHLVDELPTAWAQILYLDSAWEEQLSSQPSHNLDIDINLNNLAYVIYTSGSTGRPKGVMVEQHSLLNLVNWHHQTYQVEQQDRATQLAAFGFDAAVWEIWPYLTCGVSLHLAEPHLPIDPEELITWLRQQQITISFLPTPLAEIALAQHIGQQTALRTLLTGGDCLQSYPKPEDNIKLHNHYGPTECSVVATAAVVPVPRETNAELPSIGRPIANTQIYVLDEQRQPVPIGVAGELYIGGAGVARGYLNRPELTAEKFITNPFNDKSESRLYRTGDLGRWRSDGQLEYIGRMDHQVKLRGFRVELGEIESAICVHSAVQQAAVVVKGEQADDKQLGAYIVPNQEHAFPILQLLHLEKKNLLKDKLLYELPNGMVISYLNKSETEFIYREIWEDQTYLKNGITIKEGDCVFDVGANIGLFTLFASKACKNISIYAFEPIPPIFEVMHINVEIYGLKAKIFEYGISSEEKIDTFTYYPYVSAMSGRFADASQEREAAKSFLLKKQELEESSSTLLSEEIDELLLERLKNQSQQFNCQLRTISAVIEEHEIKRIDLLKIDVEKSELDVLLGIQEKDWHKIRQIVVEVHDINGHLEKISALLKKRGYQVIIEQDALLVDTGLHNIYARKLSKELMLSEAAEKKLGDESINPTWSSSNALTSDIRCLLQKKLPEYMVPSFFVMLEQMPLTLNGKIDRKALPVSEGLELLTAKQYVAPRTPAEELLVQLWSEVLNREKIGIHDSFFELGGHSLLATQIVSRVREVFELDLPLSVLFDQSTIAELVDAMASLYGGRETIDEIAKEFQEIENLSEQEVQQILEKLQTENKSSML
jgi:amino acid adenylation domain-containing protein/FkbM family methyltransferase